MSSQFVQKVMEEQKVKVSTMKSLFYSKNFYIFIGVMAFLLILFLIYRYFDKKERVVEMENTQENILPKKFHKKKIQEEEEENIDEEEYYEEGDEQESIYPDEVVSLSSPQLDMNESRETPISRNGMQQNPMQQIPIPQNGIQENMQYEYPQEIQYN
jgi:uncharacterized membrane protein